MNPKVIKLERGERIVAVVPERCRGPGWANTPVWVYAAKQDGSIRCECLQAEEQTALMLELFDVGAAISVALIGAVPTERAER